MAISSKIIFCKNIKLDRDNTNVLTYSESDMLTLVNSNGIKVAESTNYSFIGKGDRDAIDVQLDLSLTYQVLLQCNYIAFQNTNYCNKWYFAFIDRVQYINDGVARIHYTVDIFTTWWSYWSPKSCFVNREHVNDDTIGANTIPENLELGEYVHAKQPGFLDPYVQYWICIGIEIPPSFNQTIQSTRIFNGIYSGLVYLVFKTSTDASNWISACDEAGKGDAINCLFMIPSSLCGNTSFIQGTMGSYSFEFTWIENSNYETILASSSSFDRPQYLDIDYTPINNKLFTYPFSYFYVTNNAGADVPYRYEDFKNGIVKFRLIGAISPGCSIKAYPLNYKHMDDISTTSNSYNYGINGGKFPICSWNTDVYTNWLTQNGANMLVGDIRDFVSLGASVFTGNVGGAVSNFESIVNRVVQKHQYSFTPNQAKGNVNSGDVTFASENLVFTVYFMSIRKEYARVVDDYFNKFGYAINRIKLPNQTGRTTYNYVQIAGGEILAYQKTDVLSVPAQDLVNINKLYQRGITLWHSHATLGDYTQSNTIIS